MTPDEMRKMAKALLNDDGLAQDEAHIRWDLWLAAAEICDRLDRLTGEQNAEQ